MAANTMLRKRTDEIQGQAQTEKDWWEQRRTIIRTEFMKELDEGADGSSKQTKTISPVEKGGSDEDAVMVEADGPAAGAKGGGKKKKAGKK